jgi:2-dehydropantoate 2-reductase
MMPSLCETLPVRFIVYGAGAVGGVVGSRLFQQGHDVVLIARGAHYQTIRDQGLRLETPDGAATLPIPVVDRPDGVCFGEDDLVLLACKSQDTGAALASLAAAAPSTVPVTCLQNGVENERLALRLFAHVYGICVMCPATHLSPGVVQANSVPVTGILDVGRYPVGSDDTARSVAAALSSSTFSSTPLEDIRRWKYTKLLMNLGNAVEAVCGPSARSGSIPAMAKQEGVTCLRAAGIDFASDEEDAARRSDLLKLRPVDGRRRQGGSSWQSLSRRTGTIETDYLNGEIVLLGRQLGLPTPVNTLLQRLAREMAAAGAAPGALAEEEFIGMLD